jgi:hypothetical protein
MQEVLKNNLQAKIVTIRGMQVMIDRDLGELYKVEVIPKLFSIVV